LLGSANDEVKAVRVMNAARTAVNFFISNLRLMGVLY
jgi:hypothetical protein